MRVGSAARGRLERLSGRTPVWLRLALAVVTTVLGAVILIRPSTSLGVLALLIGAGMVLHGVVELVTASGSWRPGGLVMAALWIAAGVFVLLWLGLTVRVLAVVVGVGLVAHGALLVAAALRRGVAADRRVADALFGAAGVVFGVLALVWPDITLLAVAVVLGARLVMTGVTLAWTTIRAGHAEGDSPTGPGRLRRWARTVAAVATIALAAGAASVSAAVIDGSPVVDAFYAPPRGVPEEPGRLIRAEPFTREVPDDAEGWRILYTTTRGDGSPAVASGLVVVPADGDGPWPVVDWNHGTTGVAQSCAPSLAEEPFESGALMILPEVVAQGWALVATDYIGLGTQGPHPYLIGPDSAHASLDAVRAARELDGAHLGDQTVVWGHSQGGGAALWTGALAPEYAPELHLDGVAALAPASNLLGLVGNLPDITGGSVFASFVAAAYTAEYDDVTYRQYIRPGAEVAVRQMAERCLAPPGVLVSVLTALAMSQEPTILAADPATGPFGDRLAQNEPPASMSAPLLLAQGGADTLVTPDAQQEFVDRLCAAGVGVDHRSYDGRDHLALVAADSVLVPELVEWTRARFDGDPAAAGCDDVDG